MNKKSAFVINYMKQFAPKILNGTKTFTIRKIRKDGRVPEIGQTLRMYTGMRTANCKRIFSPGAVEPVCTGVWPARIWKPKNRGLINIETQFFIDILKQRFSRFCQDSSLESIIALSQFSLMDGWDTSGEMFDFFEKSGLPFDGNLIYWGEL